MINDILKDLKKVKGLSNINLLNNKLKKCILDMEKKSNIGVLESLKRKYTIVLTHDSNFRKPEEKIVKRENGRIIFPAVSFSEVKTKNAVSSSPSKKVHDFLVKRFNLKLKDEATLLIGFD